MARVNNNLWHKYKYKINGLVIILSCYFFYQSLYPKFPDTWDAQKVGEFEISPMPYNLEPPYLHDGHYNKDFFMIFNQGKVANIRQAYVNIGAKPLPLAQLQADDAGILHGSQHGQEVHAIAPQTITADHKMWLTIENWQGEQWVGRWDLPKAFYLNK